tara:strand:+ start:1170 stop:1967 length:798 start_codon:yes stop_codon:yes gene_type:complete
MAKYIKHSRQKNKFQCPSCEYGSSVGKSRQAVTNHFNKTHKDIGKSNSIGDISEEVLISSSFQSSEEKGSDVVGTNAEPSPIETEDDLQPDWLNFSFNEEEGSTPMEHESLPPIATSVLSHWHQSGGIPQTQENLRAFYKQQARMMRWFFNGVLDPLVSWYGKSVTSNEKFEIKRTSQEWELFEGISEQWLEYRQIILPVTPDIMMAGCIGSFYVPQVWNITKNRDKSKSFGFRGMYKRWKLKRRLKAEAKRNPLNVNEEVEPYA